MIEPPISTPRDLGAAYAAMAEHSPGERVQPIAGGTDLMVALAGEIGEPPGRVVDLWALDALRGIALDAETIVIGALTTYTEIRRSPEIARHVPALVEAAANIGAAQIQNRGTLGGNIATASPAGDTLPVLLAADASFIIGSARAERELPAEAFWTGYRRTALAPDELLLRVRIPIRADRSMRFRKVGTRRAQSISKVMLSLSWRGARDGPDRPWRDVRLALGSVAPTPIRAHATEAALEGRRPTRATADAAASSLAGELRPIDDVRSTAEYRRLVAARLLHRLIREAGGW
ncbi:MAG: xanthine dehydrogenase family protein subunit M [Candidatus Limnocylindrales bacterium]